MYSINGDPAIGVPTEEWTGGDRYGGKTGVHYRTVSGFVTGTEPGDSVEVWFEGGGETSESFTYQAVEESDDNVLIMAAEDYTGASPVQASGPNYLDFYQAALDANGTGYDVYDVDARARTAPDALGVLSHYDAVIWYTGDDIVTREPGWGRRQCLPAGAGRNSRGSRLPQRGRAGALHREVCRQPVHTPNLGDQFYDPTAANAQCHADPAVLERCRAPGGRGDFTNDMMQYWLGAYLAVDNAGTTDEGLLDVLGVDTPFTGLDWGFNGADSAENQNHSNSFITTSGILDPAVYPQFESWVAGRWDREGGPFEPHTGDAYAYSQIGDVSYKRLTRTIDVPAGGATMSFWTSYDTEGEWDHLAVEARTAGQEDWTTLPDPTGTRHQSTGDSCPAGWRELHPHLDHYQTLVDDRPATRPAPRAASGRRRPGTRAAGSSGRWICRRTPAVRSRCRSATSATGQPRGWACSSTTSRCRRVEGTTSFEAGDTGGWEITGPPAGSAPNPNNFIITTAAGFPEAAVVATPGSLMTGFGFEGITDAATRAAWMERALDHLLD